MESIGFESAASIRDPGGSKTHVSTHSILGQEHPPHEGLLPVPIAGATASEGGRERRVLAPEVILIMREPEPDVDFPPLPGVSTFQKSLPAMPSQERRDVGILQATTTKPPASLTIAGHLAGGHPQERADLRATPARRPSRTRGPRPGVPGGEAVRGLWRLRADRGRLA